MTAVPAQDLADTGDEVAAMAAVDGTFDPEGRLGRALLPSDGDRRPA